MRVELDPRQRQEVIDEARHARRLRFHDVEETLARGRIVAGRAFQRLDEARERGQRGAQFMAGIGDEIGAHFLNTPQGCEIAQSEKEKSVAERPQICGRRDRGDHRLPPTLGRNAFGELDTLGGLAFHRAGDGVDQLWNAQPDRSRFTAPQTRRHRARRRVECHDIAIAIENDGGIGQGVKERGKRILRKVAYGFRTHRGALRALPHHEKAEHDEKENERDTQDNPRSRFVPLNRRNSESQDDRGDKQREAAAPRGRLTCGHRVCPWVFSAAWPRRRSVRRSQVRRHAAHPVPSCRE